MMEFFFFGGMFEIMFFLVFFLIFGMIIFTVIRGIKEWNSNNQSPRLTVEAEVTAKRMDVSHHHHHGQSHHTTHSTSYYATFQFSTGDRQEFSVPSSQYGLLAEGDFGKLTFQGTRFLSFERM